MSNKVTIIMSLDSNDTISTHLFNEYLNACANAGIVVRYEPYTSDMYMELNNKALEVERNQALTELEEEILNNNACINGSCED